ncbi:hypothetical protein EDD16DRAFT_1835908 [Pisolithus croceorrhizus]|nr:hypothetical protein EDD16DRAFT_1835908 [Pisolithus croceorrhizus]
MYLLNAHTEQLEDIHGKRPYAILSHAWAVGERDYFQKIGTKSVRTEPGYEKVQMCCRLARQDGLDYVWIDNCCADANSRSTRSEVRISAYAWFQQAQVCYTYLGDVDGNENPRETHSQFRRSKWFGRSWTLQELLAPKHVFFFAKDWTMIGTKADLVDIVSKVTGIHKDALEYPERIPCFSIATRMSWARGRTSTKDEDRVYALMGLFDVNLPVVYGEGETKTFLKLQNEIMKVTDDQSIFAWRSAAATSFSSKSDASGILASTSECFAECGDVQNIPYDQWSEYCAEHFRPKKANPQLDVDPSCIGLQATLPVRQRGVGLDVLLACARGRAVWNGSEYIADLKKRGLICIHLQQSYRGYKRSHESRLETVAVDDFRKFSLQGIHLCTSQSSLDLGNVLAYLEWLVNGILYIISNVVPYVPNFLRLLYDFFPFYQLWLITNWFVLNVTLMLGGEWRGMRRKNH